MGKRMIFIALACLVMANMPVAAGEIDMLVGELIKQKVIDPGRGQEILTLTKENQRKLIAQGKSEVLPAWLQKISLKGDLRNRVQWEDKGSYGRTRGRIRFRLGGEATVDQGLTTHFGFCTGTMSFDSLDVAVSTVTGEGSVSPKEIGSDPRSTNQTMQDNFSTKGIWLDYAYADWTANSNTRVLIGKFANKSLIWKPSDLLWDGDITVEGAGACINGKQGGMNIFFNTGLLVLDESSSGADPSMFLFQPGIETGLGDNASIKIAATQYGFENLVGSALDHAAGSNSVDANDKLIYDYDSTSIGLELKFSGILFETQSIFAETVTCSRPAADNTGMLAGIKFGSKKVSSAGQWQVKAMNRRLEKDAWLDILPDSDAYGGKTGNEGIEVALTYGLGKNTTFGIDYYKVGAIGGTARDLYQFDLAMKF